MLANNACSRLAGTVAIFGQVINPPAATPTVRRRLASQEIFETMNNKDEVEYLNKARARAEYLATAKKRLETAPVDELLMLVRKGSGEIAMLAGEEITNRIERRLTQRAADGARFCPECHALLEDHSVYCDTCGTDTPRR